MFNPAAVINQIRNLVIGDPAQTSLGDSTTESGNSRNMGNPSPLDIVVVRAMLVKAMRLPPDIVDMVFDHAEYWAMNSNYIDYMEEHKSCLRLAGGSKNENRFLVREMLCPFVSPI